MSRPPHRNGQQTFAAGPAQRPSASRHKVDLAGINPTSTTPQSFYLSSQDFVGQNQNELSVRKGDVLHTIDRTNSGKFHSPGPLIALYCVLLKLRSPNIWARLVVLPEARRLRTRLYARQLSH